MTNLTHYSKQQWLAYVLGEEIDRAEMDAHLVDCEACLTAYMAALDQAGDRLPELHDQQAFALKVVELVSDRLPELTNQKLSALEAIAQSGDHLPKLPATKAIEQQTGELFQAIPAARAQPARRSWYMKPIVQYTIAASITIVLVGSGMFNQLFEGLSDLTRQTEYSEKATISEQLTNQADRWLDSIPNKYVQKREGIQ